MKLKGFVYCKVERIGNEIKSLTKHETFIDRRIKELQIKSLTNHEAFIDRRIKELQEEISAFESKKKRVAEYKASLVGEKCWARKELNDKINTHSKIVEFAMIAFDKETS